MPRRLLDHLARRRWLYLLGITAVGAFLRLWRLPDLPPGDGYDVAQYGLDALEIMAGARPIFLPANFGREPLFSYAVALVFDFTGANAFGIHLTSALIGIATIPAVYWAGRELLTEEAPGLDVMVGLLAAAVTAVSYWHLNYSRAGLRVIWVPLFAALISAALARGLRREARGWLALAGLLLGLSLYTYQAARLLPALVLVGFGSGFAARGRFGRRELGDLLLTFGLALLVFAPLGWFAVQQPEVFNDRLRQTALLDGNADLGAQAAALAGQTGRALAMFFIEGDAEPLYTIPGRPSLNPFLGLFFIIGGLVALWRWRRPYFLYLLAWLALMTAPAIIADQAATGKRALGAFPAVAILIAVGLIVPWSAWRRRGAGQTRWMARLWLAVVVFGLLGTAVLTYRDYFFRWGADPALAAHFQRDHSEVGLAAALAAPQELVFISPFDATHPAIRLNAGERPLRSYNGHRCLVVPAVAPYGARYVIVPGETERSLDLLAQIFPGGEVRGGNMRPDSPDPYTLTYVVPPAARPQAAGLVEFEADYVWGETIALRGYTVEQDNAEIWVTLLYEALADGGANYTATVQLLGPTNSEDGSPIWDQADSEPCGGAAPTDQWRAGDLILDRVRLDLAEPLEPGTYELMTGFYSWPAITPLPLTAPAGAERAILATIEVQE